MTDYLEELGGAEALLEEERRLDALLAGLAEADRSAEARDGAEGSGPVVRRAEQGVLSGKKPVLLDEITRLERAEVIHSSEGFWGENRKPAGMEGRLSPARRSVGAAWEPEAGTGELFALGRRGGDRGEDGLRAEDIDRAFRRDSRRYDGGFFLY